MLSNYLKVALRNFGKYWIQSLITILGLSVGFLSVILISLYVDHELNYDLFHRDSENIYRLTDPWGNESGYTRPAFVPPPWAEVISSEFAEIETYVRIDKRIRYNPLVSHGETKFFEDGFINVDSTFFRVFNFKLKSGDPVTALNDPNSIILTESKADKFFPDGEALGKTLLIDNERLYKVTGVLEDLPSQSHLNFNFILPMGNVNEFTWVYSYFTINPGTNIPDLERKIQPVLEKRFKEKYSSHKYDPKFQSLSQIHLNSNLEYEFKANGNVNYLYLMGAIGIVILVISAFNYVNMGIAMATIRTKEFGMRKTLGGDKKQLLWQSMLESILLSLVALSLSLILGYFLHSEFSNLIGKTLNWSLFVSRAIPFCLVLAVIVGLISGAYPAFFLSSMKPGDALIGKFSTSSGGALRKVLITSQFVISMVLIVGTAVIYLQLGLFKNKDLGFDREQVIVVNGRIGDGLENYARLLKDKLEKLPEVAMISFSQTVPGDYSNMANMGYKFEGAVENRMGSRTIFVSHNFIKTLGIKLKDGRDFSEELATDTATYIINEACAKMIGWKNPLGKRIKMLDGTIKMEGDVIGVMKDFHFASLHSSIEPIVLVILPQAFQKVLIRINSMNNIPSTIDKISSIWNEVLPEYPFEYQFMDQKFAGLYKADQQFSNIFEIFTVIAILLTAFGLYGMVSFDVRKRLKEIGIRRTLGASVGGIMVILNQKLLALLVIGVLIGIPVSWLLLDNWLSNFAYAVPISWWIYPSAALLLGIIGFMTTAYRVFTAARINPVDVLRND